MGEIDDATIMSALRRQMTVMAVRQVVAAGHLASVNTPGYKAREVTTFDDALDEQLASSAHLATSSGTHLEGLCAAGVEAFVGPNGAGKTTTIVKLASPARALSGR